MYGRTELCADAAIVLRICEDHRDAYHRTHILMAEAS